MAVFGLPLIFLAVQWACMLFTAADPKRQNISGKAMTLVLWLIPVISLIGNAAVYCYALGISINMTSAVGVLLGVIFLVLGNYLPKSRQNYSMGIKIAWTLHDENNWNATHRFAGFLYMGIGAVMIVLSLLGKFSWALPICLVGALAPVIYSYLYFVRHITDA